MAKLAIATGYAKKLGSIKHLLKHEQPIFIWYTNSSRKTCLKNDPSYEFIGEVILKINIV